MRFPNALGLARARGRGGVQFEGDGEITLPPVSQPVGEFSAPLEFLPLLFPAPLVANTFFGSNTFFIAGVSPAATLDFALLGSGTWKILLSIQVQTLGLTQDLTKNFNVQFIDPAGGSAALWRSGFQANAYIEHFMGFEVTLPRDGFLIRQGISAGVLADAAAFFVGIAAFKIL